MKGLKSCPQEVSTFPISIPAGYFANVRADAKSYSVGERGNVVRGEHLRREDDMMRISTGEQVCEKICCFVEEM